MALIKNVDLPSGVTAGYWRMVGLKWERSDRVASCHFDLFKDAATAATPGSKPLRERCAKLRLYGAAYDAYLSNAALAATERDAIGQVYFAAVQICQAYAAGDPPETAAEAHVVCDFGKGVFADAVEG